MDTTLEHQLTLLRRKHYKLSASALIVENDHVLMVKQGRGRKRGRWNLPGGRLDAGERFADAAVRETREETGYGVELGDLIELVTYESRSGKRCARAVYSACIVAGEPACDGREIADLRWFSRRDLLLLPDRRLCRADMLRSVLGRIAAAAAARRAPRIVAA